MAKLFEGLGSVAAKVGEKMIRAEARVDKGDDDLAVMTAKLALSSALRCRVLSGAVLTTYKVSAEDLLFQAHKTCVQEFVTVTKALREQGMTAEAVAEKAGTICGAAFNSMVRETISKLEKEQSTKEKAAKIQDAASTWTPEFLAAAIKLCKAEKAFSSKEKKLLVKIDADAHQPMESMTIQEVWTEVWLVLLSNRANKKLQGVALAGDLERRIQAIIDGK